MAGRAYYDLCVANFQEQVCPQQACAWHPNRYSKMKNILTFVVYRDASSASGASKLESVLSDALSKAAAT